MEQPTLVAHLPGRYAGIHGQPAGKGSWEWVMEHMDLLVVDGNSYGVYDDYDSFANVWKHKLKECRKNG